MSTYRGDTTELETLLEAYKVRLLNTHARLMATMDALDTLQLRHSQELRRVDQERDDLRQMNLSMKQSVKEAINERDDMRELVSSIMGQVVTSDDLGLLASRPQLAATSLVEQPAVPKHLLSPLPSEDGTAEIRLESLAAELAQEKRAHEQTRQDFVMQIALLKAQLARREAELANQVVTTVTPEVSVHGLGQPLPEIEISFFQASGILEQAERANLALEREMDALKEQLRRQSQAPVIQIKGARPTASLKAPKRRTKHRRYSDATRVVLETLQREVEGLNANAGCLTNELYVLEHVDALENNVPHDAILLIEDECIRLEAENIALRQELAELRKTQSTPDPGLETHALNTQSPFAHYAAGGGTAHATPPPYLDFQATSNDLPITSLGLDMLSTPPQPAQPLLSPPSTSETRRTTQSPGEILNALKRAKDDLEAKDEQVARLRREIIQLQRRLEE